MSQAHKAEAEEKRYATVAIAGPPNAGKSTLLNALVGEKVAIVSPKPQTTRLNQRGIVHKGYTQLVFVDTPGLVDPENLMQKSMRAAAVQAVKDADLVLALASLDTERDWVLPEGFSFPPGRTLLALNKADRYSKEDVFACALRLLEKLKLKEVVNFSALKRKGLNELLEILDKRAPAGEWAYPEDDLTDFSLRQAAAEFVRERALMILRDEVPHCLAVAVEDYVERADGLHDVTATIHVEKESHKGIVIGAGGRTLKRIGTEARLALEKLAGARVNLKLWVKVSPDWKDKSMLLRELGISPAKGGS